ncbi:MAG: cation diffusion facilitator family transporter, partial [Thiohalorhabdaceae bacterium]
AGIAGSMMGWIVLDTVAAMAVALMVVWAGGKLGWDAVRELVDTALDEQEVDRIQRQILRIEGVQSVHNLKTRRMGPEALVDAERVRRHLIDSHPEVSEVLVHVDPENDEEGIPLLAQRGEVMAEVFRCIQSLDRNLAVRDYTVHYLNGEITLDLAIEVDPNLDLEAAYAEAEAVRHAIRAHTEIGDAQVNLYVPHSETRAGDAVAN